jgi:hypothetical protein
MTRPRWAAGIAVLSLLAWAATASAECAWVLWQEMSGYSQNAGDFTEYGISIASGSQQECNKMAAQQRRREPRC